MAPLPPRPNATYAALVGGPRCGSVALASGCPTRTWRTEAGRVAVYHFDAVRRAFLFAGYGGRRG